MTTTKLNIEDNSGDKDCFTIVPNYILNHSTAIDQALYLQMKRLTADGKKDCYPSTNYLAKQLHIGKKAIKKSLKYLIDHKWIDSSGKKRIMTAGGMQWVSTYKINNIWALNNEHYKGISERDPLDGVGSIVSKGNPKDAKGGLVVVRNKEHINNLQKTIFLLKNWNERQSSPIPFFKPENIVNKYGVEKIEELIKIYGQKNGGFSQFLQVLKKG